MTLAQWAVKWQRELRIVPGAVLINVGELPRSAILEFEVDVDDFRVVLSDNGVCRLVPRPAEKGCC